MNRLQITFVHCTRGPIPLRALSAVAIHTPQLSAVKPPLTDGDQTDIFAMERQRVSSRVQGVYDRKPKPMVAGEVESVVSMSGRVALVTGAGLGIGQGIAIELARQGMRVAVHYAHSGKGAEETVAEITRAGGEAVTFGADLRKVGECRSLVDQVVATFGGLDVLVNNAGVTVARDFVEIDEETFDDLFALNIRAYFFLSQQAVPHFVERGGGSIINLSSIHGAGGFPLHSAYAATKGAVVAFTRTLAIDLADKHIRVNAIAPGVIEVPRYFEMPGYTTEFGNTMIPWGRVGKPNDIGPVAAFLASDGAEFITGQTIYVDGGTSARMGLYWNAPEV